MSVRPDAIAVEVTALVVEAAMALMAVPATGDFDAGGEFAFGPSVIAVVVVIVVRRPSFLNGGGGLKGDEVLFLPLALALLPLPTGDSFLLVSCAILESHLNTFTRISNLS